MKRRAIYTGPTIDNAGFFVNFGMTGETNGIEFNLTPAPLTNNKKFSPAIGFTPDGFVFPIVLLKKDLYFS